MCGRYKLAAKPEQIAKQFAVTIPLDFKPRYNIAPGQEILVVRRRGPSLPRELAALRWGLIPSWAKDPGIAFKMINARSETVSDKPAFRDAINQRRCLIPATGFYEWRREGKTRIPFCFTMLDDSIFAIAGIWEIWRDATGKILETASILTTSSNNLLADIHDRMPVIIAASDYDLWLDPIVPCDPAISSLLQPFDAAKMRRQQVSSRVNSVKFDDPECAEAIISV